MRDIFGFGALLPDLGLGGGIGRRPKNDFIIIIIIIISGVKGKKKMIKK